MLDKEKDLLSLINDSFGDSLNRNVICYYPYTIKECAMLNIRYLDNLRIIWFNVHTVQDFITAYESYEPNFNTDLLNFVLTPSEDVSFRNLFLTNLKDYANNLNPLIPDLLNDKACLPYTLMKDFV